MPLLGMHETPQDRAAAPSPFWDAAAINDVSAQSRFYSPDTARQLQDLQLRQPARQQAPRARQPADPPLASSTGVARRAGKIAPSDHDHESPRP